MSAGAVSSPRSAPNIFGTANSPDNLPQGGITGGGFTHDQLIQYIRRQLGEPVWVVELTNQQIADNVNDALQMFSLYVPCRRVGNLILVRGQYKYLEDVDVGQGIIEISFVEPNPVPTEIFYGNLINPAPLFRVGIDEYDAFLRWRKVWQRVTSVRPDWYYDDYERALYIHNPIERYQAGVTAFFNWTDLTKVPAVGSNWIKRYALERSRYQYGDLLLKYGGAIPAPLKDMQLDQGKRDQAQNRLDKLEDEVKGMQSAVPCSID
jgi:hypothetical protein